MGSPESPATSTVRAILANQPTLLLSKDPHAAFVALMTNPGEPSIPHSVHKTEKNHPSDSDAEVADSSKLGKRTPPVVQSLHICEVPLTNRRLLMDCHHDIVHMSHSQTINSTCGRGHYPEARFSSQRVPFQFVHVGFHTFTPSSRSVDQTVH